MTTNPLSLGTIVSFNSPKNVPYQLLRDGLSNAALDPDLAAAMLPHNAFRRACRTLSKNRVIDVVKDDKDEMVFQFTRKDFAEDHVDFNHERDVSVNKKTGVVTTSSYEFEQQAQDLLNKEIAIRHGADVTRLVHKVFDTHGGDLIKIRPQGGAYFVPASHSVLVDSLRILMNHIGGTLVDYEIGGESETTKASVSQNMFDHLQGLIEEFKTSCEDLDQETSDDVRQRRQHAVNALRVKLDAYKGLLGDFGEQIKDAINQSEEDMNKRLFGAILDTGGDELESTETVAVEAHAVQDLEHELDLENLFAAIL